MHRMLQALSFCLPTQDKPATSGPLQLIELFCILNSYVLVRRP